MPSPLQEALARLLASGRKTGRRADLPPDDPDAPDDPEEQPGSGTGNDE